MTMRYAVWIAILMVAATVRGGEREALELVWLDAHGLFPDFERVRAEADPIFRDLGAAVRWEVGSDPRPSAAGGVRIQVILMPSEPSGFRISPDTMGVVLLPNRDPQTSAYLFYRPILRNVGLRNGGGMMDPRARKDVARAIARVLVHEVVHAVAPNLSHADEGVMCEALLVGALLRQAIGIDERTKEEFLRGLAE
jgi:hypothetical protein